MNAKQLTLDASVGLLSGVMRVIGAVSISTLLFPAEMSEYFLNGVTIGVVTVVAANIVGGVRNQIPYVTYSTDYTPIFLFSIVGAELFKELPAEQFAPTIIAFVMVGSITTGITFYLVGHFRLSNLARFVPFPVVSGFMAGIGLLIVLQSLGNLAGVSLSVDSLPSFFGPNAILHWLPGVVFACVLLFGGRLTKTIFFPQLVILTAIVVFLTVLAATGTPIDQAYSSGWSATPVDGNLPFEIYMASIWQAASLPALAPHLNILITVIGVSLLSLLITLAGLEVSTKEEMRFERELEDAGYVNVASGLLGGAISYQSVSTTMMNYKMGGRTRLVPILTGAVALVFLVFGWGAAAIRYLPIALLSGLVLYVGVDFVQTWLINSRLRMTSVEYLLLVTIAITIVVWGVILGVTLGIVIAVLLFTVNYSRLRCIQLRQTGRSLRSAVERPSVQEERLVQYDEQLRLFRLQGYLFFGSAESVGEAVLDEMRRHRSDSTIPLDVILDFRSVNGIDSSATMAFAKIFEAARELGVQMTLIHLESSIERLLRRSIDPAVMASVGIFPDQDTALEAREDFILNTIHQHDLPAQAAAETLRQFDMTDTDIKELMTYFDCRQVPSGEVLYAAGAPANSMLIVDKGEFEVYRSSDNGVNIRLRKVVAGAILGEMGVYLHSTRRASVRAATDCRVYILDNTSLSRMHQQNAALALKFNRLIISVLAARLAHSNNEIIELSNALAS